MPATNYTPIQLYRSATASAAPVAGNLNAGELAINYNDGKLYYKDNAAAVQLIGAKLSGAAMATFLGTPSSANLKAVITDETGSGALVFATSPTFVTPVLGTPTSGTLTNCTGFPASGLSGLGTGVATFLATPSSANFATAIADGTGTGAVVFATNATLPSSTLTTTIINGGAINNTTLGVTTPSSAVFTTLSTTSTTTFTDDNLVLADGTDTSKQFKFQLSSIGAGVIRTWTVPNSSDTFVGVTGTQTLTNKTLASPTINTPTVSGGTIDNAAIGGSTPAAGAFTTLSATGVTTLSSGTAAAPSLNFSASTTTGLYRAGSNIIGFATAGANGMALTASNQLLVGGPTAIVGSQNAALQSHGVGGTLQTVRYVNAASSDVWQGAHTRSTTLGTVGVAVQSGDSLLDIRFNGDDGTDIATVGAKIVATVNGTVASSKIPTDLIFQTAAGAVADDISEKLRITSDGRLYGTALHNNSGAVTGTSNQYVASGTYTPTSANLSNLDSAGTSTASWMRVGNVVTVSGIVLVDPTTSGSAASFTLTLPIASDLAATGDLAGVAAGNATAANESWYIVANTGSNIASLSVPIVSGTSSHTISYTFTYVVL